MTKRNNTSGKGMSIAGLILGIVASLLAILSFGFTVGLVGLILSVIAFIQTKKSGNKNTLAIAGIALAIIAIGLSWYMHFKITNAVEQSINHGVNDMVKSIGDN